MHNPSCKEEGASLDETRASVGHPTEGVFMKCWRCQETRRLAYDGNGGLPNKPSLRSLPVRKPGLSLLIE